jgi:hypothetical protein
VRTGRRARLIRTYPACIHNHALSNLVAVAGSSLPETSHHGEPGRVGTHLRMASKLTLDRDALRVFAHLDSSTHTLRGRHGAEDGDLCSASAGGGVVHGGMTLPSPEQPTVSSNSRTTEQPRAFDESIEVGGAANDASSAGGGKARDPLRGTRLYATAVQAVLDREWE